MIKIKDFKDLRPVYVVEDVRKIAGVDQYDSQDFNLNDCGFIRNDLSQLMRAQSQAEYDARLRKLMELPTGQSLPDDMPIEDAIASVIPKYAQSPAELASYAELLSQRDMSKLHDAYEKSLKGVKVVSKESPAPVESPSAVSSE